MKAFRCSRAWQAEAVADGRLSAADAASFERHVATCAVCTREVRTLAALRDAAARLPVLTSTPLDQRRLRIELLRRANELTVSTPRALWQRSIAAALVVAALAAVLVLLLRAPSPARMAPITPANTEPPSFQITASQGAEWRTQERRATLLLLSAKKGRFEVAVDKLRTGQRFLLALPDGEIEVQGTRFIVDTDGARTLSVHVLEGRVALRLRAHPPVVLAAGQRWTAAPSPARTPIASSETKLAAAAEASPSTTAMSAGPRRQASTVRPPAADAGSPPETTPAPRTSAVNHDFKSAMSAFSDGDYGRAELLFTDFEKKHPDDARVQDSMFLRAVARSRRGDSSGARAMAREYLKRYPNGLRRPDAERLAR
jgi:TolA-binding protein